MIANEPSPSPSFVLYCLHLICGQNIGIAPQRSLNSVPNYY